MANSISIEIYKLKNLDRTNKSQKYNHYLSISRGLQHLFKSPRTLTGAETVVAEKILLSKNRGAARKRYHG